MFARPWAEEANLAGVSAAAAAAAAAGMGLHSSFF